MPNLASCAPILANWRYRKASIAAMSPTSRIRHIGYVTPDLAGDYVLPHTIDVPAPGLQLLDLSRVGHPLTPSLYSRVVILVWTLGGAPIVAKVVERTPRRAYARARSVGDFAFFGCGTRFLDREIRSRRTRRPRSQHFQFEQPRR
jgi:hypothetical protein